MRISSYYEFRRNLAAAIDRVNADREPLIITRDWGKPMAVLTSLEDFVSYEERRDICCVAPRTQRGCSRRSESSSAARRLVFSERVRRPSSSKASGAASGNRSTLMSLSSASARPQAGGDDTGMAWQTAARPLPHSPEAGACPAAPAACAWARALATVAMVGAPPSCIDSTAVDGTMTMVALLRFKPS